MLLFVALNAAWLYAQPYTNLTFHNDKAKAKLLCDKSQYTEPTLFDCGSSIELEESHSAWYKFTIRVGGTLDFVIQPLVANDDIDFRLLCVQCGEAFSDLKKSVSDGPFMRGNQVTRFNSNKGDKTGLDPNDSSIHPISESNSSYQHNGFLKSLAVNSTETYYLLVNNYWNTNGFTITWGGTCSFESCSQNKQVFNGDNNKTPVFGELYPNPTSEKINLQVDYPVATNTIIRILDLNGREIYRRKESVEIGVHHYEIDVTDLSKGLYIVELTDSDKTVFGRRFIKLD